MPPAGSLRWSHSVEATLQEAADYFDAVRVLYSILFDPEVDGVYKFQPEYNPYIGQNLRVMLDDVWHLSYRVDDDYVTIYTMCKRALIG